MSLRIRNRRAYFDYEIIEKFESGIKLLGFEVKAIKEGRAHLTGSYVKFLTGGTGGKSEPYLVGALIQEYSKAGAIHSVYNPTRDRKLLMHAKEIYKYSKLIENRGYTLVPIKFYLKGTIIKLEVGVAKGKKKVQKKVDLMKKQQERDYERNEKASHK